MRNVQRVEDPCDAHLLSLSLVFLGKQIINKFHLSMPNLAGGSNNRPAASRNAKIRNHPACDGLDVFDNPLIRFKITWLGSVMHNKFHLRSRKLFAKLSRVRQICFGEPSFQLTHKSSQLVLILLLASFLFFRFQPRIIKSELVGEADTTL